MELRRGRSTPYGQGKGCRVTAGRLRGETRKRCGEGCGAVRAPEVPGQGEEMSSHRLRVGVEEPQETREASQTPVAPFPHPPASGGLGHLPDLELLQETKFSCLQLTRGRRGGERGGVATGRAGWLALPSSGWAWSAGPASASAAQALCSSPTPRHGHGGRRQAWGAAQQWLRPGRSSPAHAGGHSKLHYSPPCQ